jgi:hypothetical protein
MLTRHLSASCVSSARSDSTLTQSPIPLLSWEDRGHAVSTGPESCETPALALWLRVRVMDAGDITSGLSTRRLTSRDNAPNLGLDGRRTVGGVVVLHLLSGDDAGCFTSGAASVLLRDAIFHSANLDLDLEGWLSGRSRDQRHQKIRQAYASAGTHHPSVVQN